MNKYIKDALLLGAICMGQMDEIYNTKKSIRYNDNINARANIKSCEKELREFIIHGKSIMAYSRKDALKRYNHSLKK